jgi:HEPN domain-containing protein
MAVDPEGLADAEAWLRKAVLDVRSARVDLAASPPIVSDALFHTQQAVEKSLKAFLALHDVPFRRTHDLGELGRQCVAIDATLEPILHATAPLTEYAWRFRYPGDTIEPEAAVATAALDLAEPVVTLVGARLAMVRTNEMS